MQKRQHKKGRPVWAVSMAVIGILSIILLIWTWDAEQTAHYVPCYPLEDITPYLQKQILTKRDYDVLCHQTGLSKTAIDTLRRENKTEKLLAVQERFFAEVNINCECHSFIFRETLDQIHADKEERTSWETAIPAVEDGDILITFNSHFLGWRNGHAAIVIDAGKGLTLEALTLGRNSAILNLDSWLERPSFAVLRLRGATREERAKIAEYAGEHLNRIPYRLSAGIGSERIYTKVIGNTEAAGNVSITELCPPTGTHCSHLVWYAYEHFGYDLDSDGGLVVTPKDLYESPLLETIQVYGMKID